MYGPAVWALIVVLALSALARTKQRQGWWRPGLSLACLVGWAALEPLGRLRAAALTPPVGPAMLIVAALGVVVVEGIRRWRAGRNDRLLSVVAAGWVGWWVARVAAGPAEFWRVGIITAGLSGVVAIIVRQEPGRALALVVALWGGLVVSGVAVPWCVAMAVLAVAGAGAWAAGVPAAVPSALFAAGIAGVELANGRLARGHLGAVDYVCLLALAASVLTGLLAPRLGKKRRGLAPILAAAGSVAASWAVHRLV